MKQIIRGGGGHVAAGLASVPDGAFVVECPACPHPDRNLPKDWDKAPEATRYVGFPQSPGLVRIFPPRWLYSLFLAVDANFRLKLKSRGITDPEIGSGWSYFVEPKQYNEHISQKTTEVEVSPSGSSISVIVLIFLGWRVRFRFPCCEPGQQEVFEGLPCLRCGRLCVRTALSHAKECGR